MREKLANFANGAMSLEDFADWVDRESWSMHRDSEPEAIKLVSSIHGLLAERDARAIDDATLRQKLIGLLNDVRAALVIGGPAEAASPRASASRAYVVSPAQPWELPASA